MFALGILLQYISMSQKSHQAKKERADLQRDVEELAQRIADKKEYIQVIRVELERYTFRARHNRKRLQGLQVGALNLEDASERSKTNAEIKSLQREVDDTLFKLATKRSDARRNAQMIRECEEHLGVIQKALQASGRKADVL